VRRYDGIAEDSLLRLLVSSHFRATGAILFLLEFAAHDCCSLSLWALGRRLRDSGTQLWQGEENLGTGL
jgi:hypothetical protein